jgi:GT2 family glycosyltransferase
MKKVSIIILNWNGRDFISNCLKSIKKFTDYPNYEVIVVDQGSTDGSIEIIKKEFSWVRLVKNKKNVGFSEGNNQGFRKAKGEYFIMLNNDTLVTKDWLTSLVETIENNNNVACVGSKLISPNDYKEKKFRIGQDKEDETVCGAAMLIKKEVIKKIGYLDSKNFSPIYGEENDWCYRTRNNGYKVMQSNRSIIVHLGQGDTAKQIGVNQFNLLENHRLKAMLFNLPLRRLINFIPGLSLIFLRSIFQKRVHILLKVYLTLFKERDKILRERYSRLKSLI